MDANATDRVLLQSSKPSLHTNVNCTALVAAVVSRKISIVRFLLQVIFSTSKKNENGVCKETFFFPFFFFQFNHSALHNKFLMFSMGNRLELRLILV